MRIALATMTLLAVALICARGALAQDVDKAKAGERVYETYCATCHGDGLVSSGQSYDLRKLTKDERPRFDAAVLNGKNQMPPWKGVLSSEELDQLWHYVRANANDR